ncbi:low molecular weight protein-tyrosine-phosphatase [Xylanibacter oryzae]|uniref:low molecular weight protein-tyrosine-phosphatase n=1 Tax=Xylanibacter oryzae TaxID=185293 RepID=UPI0004BBE8E1|nr:low molecular weight protein-tyrosine-phosphatase [Xylanibacter oryzae]
MKKVSLLFVCLGNICRSPAAEDITKKIAEDKGILTLLDIDSAGIGDWHIGQLPDARMRKHGYIHGYKFNSKARQICMNDFNRFDYIIAMDKDNYSYLSNIAPNKECKKKILRISDYLKLYPNYDKIPDPYYGDDDDFENVIILLEDACKNLPLSLFNK